MRLFFIDDVQKNILRQKMKVFHQPLWLLRYLFYVYCRSAISLLCSGCKYVELVTFRFLDSFLCILLYIKGVEIVVRTIGIDLGTTYSLAAYWDGSQAVIIPNVLGEHVTPSIVSVDAGGEVLVGRIAQERLITHPQLTASTFKRFMGSAKKYTLGTMTFTPEELSSFVLRSLKEDAENHLGESVTKAIISVPAYFNDVQRKATKKAAELAGLQVERLISEPTAAALAYETPSRIRRLHFLFLIWVEEPLMCLSWSFSKG